MDVQRGRPLAFQRVFNATSTLRQVESGLVSAYAAYARSRLARVIARPMIGLLVAVLVYAKAMQLARFVRAGKAAGDTLGIFSFWSVALYYALTIAFLVLALALFVTR